MMKMKNVISLAVMLLIATLSHSQNCKYSCNERDEFTGNFVKETKKQDLYKKFSTAAHISFRKITSGQNKVYSVKFIYATTGTQSIVVGVDDMLMLKLSNDSIVEIFPLELSIAKTTFVSTTSVTSISVRYRISSNQLVLLKDFEIIKCRFYTTDGYIEDEVKNENYQQKIKFGVNCILD